ncbi:MAG: non-canonical purine NTP pyrophosphatase [Candidatus Bipolaricaulota bacterium]
MLGDLRRWKILTKEQCPFEQVEEDCFTYRGNALKKADGIRTQVSRSVLADDSGLEVSALAGRPGVKSSRYAGQQATDQENNRKLLSELESIEDRSARFLTVAVVVLDSDITFIECGLLRGSIAREPRGSQGFGYDPLFVPVGYEETLAELGPRVKNEISHRRKALQKIKADLNSYADRCLG